MSHDRRTIHVPYPDAGVRAQLAERFSGRARVRRHERFFPATGIGADARILDVGCGRVGLRALEPELDITGLDVVERPEYPGPFVLADAADGLSFGDDKFDLVYCSSVIEHVPVARRAAFAAELRRVAKGWFVQTPARSFPIEPHALLPGAHWLPRRARARYWKLGAGGLPEEVELLSRRELEALFGPAVRERLGPLTKSWISIRPVAG